MKANARFQAIVLVLAGASCAPVSAFSFQGQQQHFQGASTASGIHQQQALALDIQETAQRDVFSLQEWARNCGVQTIEGFELTSADGEDWSVYSTQAIPAGTPVVYVPASLVLSSYDVETEFGGNLEAAENALVESDGSDERLPLFRLMVKILSETEAGYESPYYPWLDSLPRRFYNGVAMTDACFECLPPYAAWLSTQERNTYSRFLNALRKGYLELSEATLENDNLIKWAYNVALTRHQEIWLDAPRQDGATKEKKIAPMADMLNHATVPNAEIQYDAQGNCVVTTTQDVPAGSPLVVSLGDPSNPTPIFAKYGFLCDDCPTIFCKAMHLQTEMESLGYDFLELVFYTETGEIAPKVWDLFLYSLLRQSNNHEEMQAFGAACQTNDEATKQSYHQHYFSYTLDALKQYVASMLQDVEYRTQMAGSYNLQTHPRVPIIVAHNTMVQGTLLRVQAQLESMG